MCVCGHNRLLYLGALLQNSFYLACLNAYAVDLDLKIISAHKYQVAIFRSSHQVASLEKTCIETFGFVFRRDKGIVYKFGLVQFRTVKIAVG